MENYEDSLEYESVPSVALRLFRLNWQLETWLRMMVYVELRAAKNQWEESIKKHVRRWPPPYQAIDKSLHHMATHHQSALSYLTFGQLWDVISDDDNWSLFAPYFPPKDNVVARIKEVKTIRNRVAHFREPHPRDEERLRLFLHDLHDGLRRFFKRYTIQDRAKNSPIDNVSKFLARSWISIGSGVELNLPEDKWLYAPDPHRRQPLMHAGLEKLFHPNSSKDSDTGVIYRLKVRSPSGRELNIDTFLERTQPLHECIIHIVLQSHSNEVFITIPAIRGAEGVGTLIAKLLKASINSLTRADEPSLMRVRTDRPEYILQSNHLLSFYSEEIPGTIIDFT